MTSIRILLSAAGLVTLAATPAIAADDLEELSAPASTVVWFGAEAGDFGHVGYAGLVTAFNGDLGQDDWLLRISGSFGEFDYTSAGTGIELNSLSGDIMIGYQTVSPDYVASIYAGIDFQDYEATPNDPNNSTIGEESGFKVQGEFTSRGSDIGHLNLIGNYSTANDSYYTRARLGFYLGDGIVVGPEGSLLGNEEFDGTKIGGFIGGLQLGEINLTINAGHQDSDGVGGSDGFYGGIGASVLF